MDRGDRVSIQGDGHPTMAAALAAFPSPSTYDLVHEMLVKTDSGGLISHTCSSAYLLAWHTNHCDKVNWDA